MTPLDAFTAWFIANGGHLHPAVEFARTRAHGYILRVRPSHTGRLPPDTAVVSCPHALTLSALNAVGRSPGAAPPVLSPLPDAVVQAARPQCIATIWLCAHYLLDAKSPWHAYVALLPKPPAAGGDDVDLERGDAFAAPLVQTDVIDTAMWWGDEERAWVAGTNLARGIDDLEGTWRGEWERYGDAVGAWAEENGLGLGRLDWNLFKWAVAIYGSRAFSSAVLSFASSPATGRPVLAEGDPHALLYPGVDIINHDHATKNRWFCDAERFGIICEDGPGPGEQVWNSYGKKANAELLLSFGFSLQDNDCDAFALKLPPSRGSAPPQPTQQPPVQSRSAYNNAFHPSASVSRLPASTRFPSSSTTDSATDKPPTYKTLSLNETDTLEPHDAENNVYYVRRPASLPKPGSSPTPTMHNPQRPGYPTTNTATDLLAHLSGFPIALLQQLATLLANSHEEKTANASPPAPSTASALDDAAQARLERFWRQHPRNELAVTALLQARLDMEGARLAALRAADDDGSKDVARGVAGDAEPTTAPAATRKHYARTYLHGQLDILARNADLLRRRVLRAVVAAAGDCLALVPQQARQTDVFVTLPAMLRLLRRLSPELAADFVAGVFGTDGHDDAAVAEEVEAMRSGASERDEEDILVLLAAAVFNTLFYILGGDVGSGGQGVVGDEQQGRRRDDAQAMRRWPFFQRIYGLVARDAAAGDKARAAADDEYDDGISETASEVQQAIRTIRAAAPGSRLWMHSSWRSQGLAGACVQMVTEETLSVRLRRHEYGVFAAAVAGDGGALAAYLRDGSGVRRDAMFGPDAGERRVVLVCTTSSTTSTALLGAGGSLVQHNGAHG